MPSYLMNAPLSYSADSPNNVWMEELSESERVIDNHKAMKQFLQLYQFIGAHAFVQNLPTPGNCQLQDLPFISNLGIVLDHLPDKRTVIISNFATEPRRGETEVGIGFFNSMGYDVHTSPYHFEGEAELKHLHDNVYVGGYGIRSDIRAYEWMEKQFDIRIIKVRNSNDRLYHLDGSVFPMTRNHTLVCTAMFTKPEIQAIERETEIIDVTAKDALAGITNSVRVHRFIINASNLCELKSGTDAYYNERMKNQNLEKIAVEMGFDVCFFNIDEFYKGGAMLSCMVLHLNRRSYEIDLL
ncbi:amidinotransferase [candidate division KSB1 bacterium]|nr:amidinotransferase [candidate division KSB1 bacterium]